MHMTIPRLNYVFCLEQSLSMTYFMICQRKKKVYKCEYHGYEETTSINSVQSSLKTYFVSNPVSYKRILQEFLLDLFHYFLSFSFMEYLVYDQIILFIQMLIFKYFLFQVPWWGWLVLAVVLVIILLTVTRNLENKNKKLHFLLKKI